MELDLVLWLVGESSSLQYTFGIRKAQSPLLLTAHGGGTICSIICSYQCAGPYQQADMKERRKSHHDFISFPSLPTTVSGPCSLEGGEMRNLTHQECTGSSCEWHKRRFLHTFLPLQGCLGRHTISTLILCHLVRIWLLLPFMELQINVGNSHDFIMSLVICEVFWKPQIVIM